MSQPRPNNPDDESELPWDEESGWEEEETLPPWLPSAEEGKYWQSSEAMEEEPDEWPAPYIDFTDIPAWQDAHRYALRIAQLSRGTAAPLQRHPALVNLRRQSYLAAVDLAYGHDEGYGPRRRRAHLKRCRQGLSRIHHCLSLIETVQMLDALPPESHQELFDQTITVRDALVHWMEQVRRF